MNAEIFDTPLWTPAPQRAAQSAMAAFSAQARAVSGLPLADYAALHAWSVDDSAAFWQLVWDFCEVVGDLNGSPVLVDAQRMPGAAWFPGARLNFAENLLRASSNAQALVFRGEDKAEQSLTRAELCVAVARCAAALRAVGVEAGDRVAAWMPNMPQTLIAMLAAASIGAVFTSASPDFGVQGVLDRFGQTTPKVLFACDGYWYNGKAIDIRSKLAELAPQLPSVQRWIVVPYLSAGVELSKLPPGAVAFDDFIAPFAHATVPKYERLPFNHPLYVMYSSGTTGVPKCIVHGAGGTLVQHLKELCLHSDVRAGDRLFYFTTCGWMMWNWLVSGLAVGATLLLFDGNPFVADGRILWDYAAAERCTHFGTSAKYIETLAKGEVRPAVSHDLSNLRAVLSTGSPLAPQSFDFVYTAIKSDIQLASISGGTDIISCFVLGNPLLPVWRGEIQCAGLGMAVDVWDEEGHPVRGAKGELVCLRPFPSMPIGFWNDADGRKYHAAYFERFSGLSGFSGVWCHGDFCEITAHGGLIIHGRSDATLNPGGVRIGTAEIYRQVEKLPEVLDAVVIGQDWPPQTPTDVRVVLFVRLRAGLVLDDVLMARIRQTIRDNTTPRHVPAKIVQVDDVPRTKSGKIVELAVRNVVHGLPVKNIEALANPQALAEFRGRAELTE
ncbi:MAG: acetoacetate--CoA ligase [Rhodoferax sp.]|nr:acetoacetate--CoA ligase [Rhodoferax sp.]